MHGFFVGEAEAVSWLLSEMAREVEERREEEPGKKRSGNEGELERQQWGRKAVRLDVRCAQERDLSFVQLTTTGSRTCVQAQGDQTLTFIRVMLTVSMKSAVAALHTTPSSPRVKPRRASRTQTYRLNW